MRKKCSRLCAFLFAFIALAGLAGLALPGDLIVPVSGASGKNWNAYSFWYYPWGVSGVHKGIDIFAAEGTPVVASSPGIVIYSGNLSLGGNVVGVIGPKWRICYYAHLGSSSVRQLDYVRRGQVIGSVGTSGNARGKPPHLHFAVLTTIPYIWRIDKGTQGWKKIYFLDPNELLRNRDRPCAISFRKARVIPR